MSKVFLWQYRHEKGGQQPQRTIPQLNHKIIVSRGIRNNRWTFARFKNLSTQLVTEVQRHATLFHRHHIQQSFLVIMEKSHVEMKNARFSKAWSTSRPSYSAVLNAGEGSRSVRITGINLINASQSCRCRPWSGSVFSRAKLAARNYRVSSVVKFAACSSWDTISLP